MALFAESPLAPEYDDDGNLTQDGRWSYTWNAENRLIAMETLPAAYTAGTPRERLEFLYDYQGRRISKTVSTWDSVTSSYLPTSSTLYLYDGWNLIAELESLQSSPFTLHHSYIWGSDLSGSLQGAGGVGGLLAVTDSAGSTAYPYYDGNGNVMGYYDATTAATVAEFEYGPFGERIRESGPKAGEFTFRFSTKYEDAETGLLYYGFRYYDSQTGRWLNRDPIEEKGGLNLYAMVGNNAVRYIDYLGLSIVDTIGNLIDRAGGAALGSLAEQTDAHYKAGRYQEAADTGLLLYQAIAAGGALKSYKRASQFMNRWLAKSHTEYKLTNPEFDEILGDPSIKKDIYEYFVDAYTTGVYFFSNEAITQLTATDLDWFYSLGEFSLQFTGLACVDEDNYRVGLAGSFEMIDKYDWEGAGNKDVGLTGNTTIKDVWAQNVEDHGYAQSYKVGGKRLSSWIFKQ